MSSALTIEPALPSEHVESFRLAFQHLPAKEQVPRIQSAMELIQKKELDPAGIFVARKNTTLVGSLICMTTPGAGALVWPPQALDGARNNGEVEDRLVQHASDWLRR